MENATKALLISAGILFAIVVVSRGVISYGRIKNYYGDKQSSLTTEQLAAFNLEYESYNRTDVTGFELVSLINKIINFNNNNAYDENLGYMNSDKNFQKMYVEFELNNTILLDGISDGINNVKLFDSKKYDSEHPKTNTKLTQIIGEMQGLENQYGASVLTKLVSNRQYLSVYGGDATKTIRQVIGKFAKVPGYNGSGAEPTGKIDDAAELIIKYEQYLEFKRAVFKCTETKYNENTGRIVKLIFEQIK